MIDLFVIARTRHVIVADLASEGTALLGDGLVRIVPSAFDIGDISPCPLCHCAQNGDK